MCSATRAVVLIVATMLSGCTARISLIDRTDGAIYSGATEGGTVSGSGQMAVEIEGEKYVGPWIYQPNGGNFSFGSFNSTTNASGTATNLAGRSTSFSGSGISTGTASMLAASTVGNGMANVRAPSGKHIRCVFTFHVMQNTGMGECQRNDGRTYDMQVKR